MARDTTDQTPISSVQELTDYLAGGCKPKDKFRIGTEHEKFAFFREGNKPVPYFGDASISALLKGMQEKLGWEPIMDGDNIIGLASRAVWARFPSSPAASSSFPARLWKPA